MRQLLALSVGPVQEFIAAARRTRDLWFGSKMLSEVSKAAAKAVGEQRLIFPASADAENVANVILAELEDGVNARDLADRAEAAALGQWGDYAAGAWRIAGGVLDRARWEKQVRDVLEFYAAWTPFGSDAEYRDARRQVMRLLAGRKNCRNFEPGRGEAGVPKSSLDGAREAVWTRGFDASKLDADLARKLRLSPGEQLDSVAVVKRLGGGTQNYPSVSRIAADPWLRGLGKQNAGELQEMVAECRLLHQEGILSEVKWKTFEIFPYEGSAAYRNRHRELEEETKAKGRLERLGKIVQKLERHGIPNPYLAVLAADGDGMGKAISKIGSAGQHRQFSHDLARFAERAKQVMEAHHGHLIYSGGDDVLALVALDRALECAWELREVFRGLLEGSEVRPTLSVGIAIGHFLEPMEDLLHWAREAEHDAKEAGGNALAVHLHTRGGAPLRVAGLWSDPDEGRLDLQLLALARMHLTEQIPDKAGYDLRELAREYEGWPVGSAEEKAALAGAIRADAVRLVARKRARRPAAGESPLLRMVRPAACAADLRRVADRVILASHFAEAKRQAGGETT